MKNSKQSADCNKASGAFAIFRSNKNNSSVGGGGGGLDNHHPNQSNFAYESGQKGQQVNKLKGQKINQHNNKNDFQDNQMFKDSLPDEDGFFKSVIEHSNVDGNDDDDPLFDNFGSQMLIMGDDMQQINKNFAGDTFSQISSTYEQQVNLLCNNQQMNQQQSQNDCKNKHQNASKLYSYHEKKSKQPNNDELLDSAILDNMNEDLHSPKDNNNNFFMNVKGNNNCNQIIDFQLFNNHALPSGRSHLNNIIMNSENLQQSEVQSTMTIYNSGIFDDASIMRILDKSISDDSLFLYHQNQDETGNRGMPTQQSYLRSGVEVEQSFKFECEDVKQILANVSLKFKEKLQKQRSHHGSSQSQLIAISVDELKQFEILTSSAIEKIRQIQGLGKHFMDTQKVKTLAFKNYKQNLKIQIHNQIQKFKDTCKKQYQQAERQKFKYQINEFELNEKIKQYEDRFEMQAKEINKLANRCEQYKYEKQVIGQKYEKKLNQIESILKVIMKTVQQQGNKKGKAKANNSFCLGVDHSMLLQPSQKKRIQIINKHNDIQQSVDEKENESILSNQMSSNNPSSEIKNHLEKIKLIVADKVNPIKLNLYHQQQEGGSYYDSSSMFNLMGELNNDIKRDSLIQQSQFVPEESEADVNQAFIQSQEGSSHLTQSEVSNNQLNNCKLINIEDEDEEGNNQSIEYKFDKNHVLVVMDGKANQSNGGIKDLMYLDEKISTGDLKGRQRQEMTETQKLAQEQQRQKMLVKKNIDKFENQFFNKSIENSLEDDLNILQNLSREEVKKNEQNSMFPVNLSAIDQSINFKESMQGGMNFESGRNIFIVDEFGGSIGFNSRNDEKLYSGGSSQFSMIQAFQSIRSNKNQCKEMIVINVLDRKINIPKLNLKVISEYGEPFKHNIQNTITDDMSSLTESQIPYSSKTLMQPINTHHDQANVNSFQNESISKQYQENFINTDESGPQTDPLDKAICIDNSKVNYSVASSKEAGGNAGQFNMFDSFKKELSLLEKSKQEGQSNEKEKVQGNDDTLILDESAEFNKNEKLYNDQVKFNEEFKEDLIKIGQKDQKKVQEDKNEKEDKSMDLSVNISRFKKSLSDPNLVFNDVDSDDEMERDNDTSDSKNAKKVQEEFKQPFSQKEMFNFHKLKTPQNIQGKLKFQMPSNDGNNQNQNNKLQPHKLNIRKSLGQFQAKMRSSSGNSRQNQENEGRSQIAQVKAKNIKGMIKIQKFNIIHRKEKSRIEERDQDQSMLVKQPSMNFSVLHPQRIESPDKGQQSTQVNTSVIKRFISNPKNRRDARHFLDGEVSSQEPSSQTNSALAKPQLIQNYMVSAQAMQGPNSSNKQTAIKITNPKSVVNLTRNSFALHNPNMSHNELNESFEKNNNAVPAKKKITGNMIQQMKDYQESQDLSVNQGVLRKPKKVERLEKKSKDDDVHDNVCLSPSHKTPQRTSQSCTPQKKNIIVVSKQIIKANPKKFNISNISQVDVTQTEDTHQQVRPISLKKISLAKRRSNNNAQNITVINQSIDQSQIYASNPQPNESVLVQPNIDSSLMMNDLSIINPRIPTKLTKAKVKKLITQQQSTTNNNDQSIAASNNGMINNPVNINIQSLLNSNKGQGKSALNKQLLIQKLKNQQQQQQSTKTGGLLQMPTVDSQYHSNQSQQERQLNHSQQQLIEGEGIERNYQSNQQPITTSNPITDVKRTADDNRIQNRRRRENILKSNLNNK